MQTMTDSSDNNTGTRWLVLIHQFPQEPGSLRVKIWRRLQSIGAVAIKNSMYVLPMNDETQEDFQWVLRELIAGGADGAILESRFIDGMSDQQIQGLFDTARDTDYAVIAEEVREFLARLPKAISQHEEQRRDARNQLARFRKKLTEIEVIDFFGANGREAAEGLINALAEQVTVEPGANTWRLTTACKSMRFGHPSVASWLIVTRIRVNTPASNPCSPSPTTRMCGPI